jgi:hypothetical protein
MMPIDSVMRSDGHGPGECTPSRLRIETAPSVRPVAGAQNESSVVPVIFWRRRGEVQPPGTVVPGRDHYGSGLRDRPADPERARMFIRCLSYATILADIAYRRGVQSRGAETTVCL